MSKTNPSSSLKALFPKPIDCGFDVFVYPLSLGHYALLEKIDSYLVNGNHLPDSLEVIRTFFICTRQSSEIVNLVSSDSMEEFDKLAFEWAENLPPILNKTISDAIKEQIDSMMKVLPIVGEQDKKKVMETAS